MKLINLLFIATLVTLLFSCKEETTDSSKAHYRIKQVLIDYENDGVIDYKNIFSYDENNLLSQIIRYEKDETSELVLYSKSIITYVDNTATRINYYYNTGEWNASSKFIYTIDDELMLDETYYYASDGEWNRNWKWVYEYSDGNLTAWRGYYDNSGTLALNAKGLYTYQSGKLTESGYYSYSTSTYSWSQYYKEMFSYTSNQLTSVISYDLNDYDIWENDYKSVYSYSGNKVSSVYDYNWSDDAWGFDNYINYDYDSHGNLIELEYFDGEIVTYEYENKKGNAKLFLYYPEELVFQIPTLSSKGSFFGQVDFPNLQRKKTLMKPVIK